MSHKSCKGNKSQIREVWQRLQRLWAQRERNTLCLTNWLCLSFQAPPSMYTLVSRSLSQCPWPCLKNSSIPQLCSVWASLEAGSTQQQASCLSNKLKLIMIWKNGGGHLGPLAQEAWLSQTLIGTCVVFQAPAHAAHRVFQAPRTIWILCSSCGPCFTPHLSITLSEGAEVEKKKKANSLSVSQAESLLSTKFASIHSSFV